ncbi:MAG TPA: caspase family protein [Vicinamibacterales bacterium]|nr:caspase family protein [Vicinamibacterales bacterium]
MSDGSRRLNLIQFAHLLDAATLGRRVTGVHVHHTRHPSRGDFLGRDSIEAIRRYQVETFGWPDLAQHLTIDPSGGIWTGRNWNLPPASVAGENGTASGGPFMVELVGNFDEGFDPFDGGQREAAVEVIARLVRAFRLDTRKAIAFHRDLTRTPTTCPGSGIDRARFLQSVRARIEKLARVRPARRGKAPLFRPQHLAGFHATLPAEAGAESAGEVPEHSSAALEIAARTTAAIAVRQIASRPPGPTVFIPRDSAEWADLKPHVVNLSRGELSQRGAISTSPADLDGIIARIRAHVARSDTQHVLLHAHGGLVGERSALEYARTVRPWWMDHGIYPVFFIWESDLFETLRQYIIGPRALADLTDAAIETAAKAPGSIIWSGMKESARRAASAAIREGDPGGAWLFAQRLAVLSAELGPDRMALHAVGHSAGAIFHSHLLPVLTAQGVPIATASVLAPAVRTDLFKDTLLPEVRSGLIRRLTMFTMEEDAERQDDCWTIYRKSLLYLVSRSFEGLPRRPILGLHESVRKDAVLRELFGVDESGRRTGRPSAAELQLSYAPGSDPNPLTRALRHGDFDNDPYTMSAALRRILALEDETGIGFDDFPWPPAVDRAFELPVPAAVAVPQVPAAAAAAAPVLTSGQRRVALCVGIDRYVQRPLAGCVNDARTWGEALGTLGFDVQYLFDSRATRAAMLDGLERLVSKARAGDVVVFQYSGHGTQLADTTGDERDRFDEAFVPVDYHTGAFLIDDDVSDVLSGLPRGVLATLFTDCCHSGTITRFAPAMRALETTSDRVRFLPIDPSLEAAHQEFRRPMRAPARKKEKALPGVIHFAACRDDEYAWESGGHGDFTTAAAPLVVQSAGRGDTNEVFLDEVYGIVSARGRQHPMLMPPAAGMSRLALLAPLTSVPPSAGPARDERQVRAALLAHVEAIRRLLQA